MSPAKSKCVSEINGFVFLCIFFILLNQKEYTRKTVSSMLSCWFLVFISFNVFAKLKNSLILYTLWFEIHVNIALTKFLMYCRYKCNTVFAMNLIELFSWDQIIELFSWDRSIHWSFDSRLLCSWILIFSLSSPAWDLLGVLNFAVSLKIKRIN